MIISASKEITIWKMCNLFAKRRWPWYVYTNRKKKAEGKQEDAKQHNQVFAVDNIFLNLIYYFFNAAIAKHHSVDCITTRFFSLTILESRTLLRY